MERILKWFIKSVIESVASTTDLLIRTLTSEDTKWTYKLYALTLALPLTLTIMNILFCGISGLETRFGFFGNFKVIWIDYYFTGEFCHVDAWRWQLGIFGLCFFFNKFSR